MREITEGDARWERLEQKTGNEIIIDSGLEKDESMCEEPRLNRFSRESFFLGSLRESSVSRHDSTVWLSPVPKVYSYLPVISARAWGGGVGKKRKKKRVGLCWKSCLNLILLLRPVVHV